MPHIDKHAPGSFCWVELATTDQDAAKAFYSSLFGWTPVDYPMGPTDFYTMFKLEGKDAAAGYSMRPDDRAKGIPPHWMLYVAAASADETAAKVGPAGGTLLAPPFDVFTFGRMAVIQDPTGAIFSIWESKSHLGITITGVDGTLCWADLSTADPERAKQFYSTVFGWEIEPGEHDSSGYLHIKNGEQFIGGIQAVQMRNPNAPPHWLLYFLVSDCDASTAKAEGFGAKVFAGPMSLEKVGRFSIIADPQGAVFSLFQPETPA